jgi:Mn2+/Fe2+ NRAMP family transporter
VHADWGAILRNTLIPAIHLNREYLTVAFAVLGTTISPYLYFWQASEEAEDTKQKHHNIRVCKFRPISKGDLKAMREDTIVGMVFSNTVSFFIIALAATTLYAGGAGHIETLRDAALALKPLAGPYTYLLFMTGILGAGLLSIPVLAGSAAYVLAELFGWNGSLDSPFTKARQFYLVMSASILIGLFIPFLGVTPVQALFYSAIFNGLISPLLIILIIHMARNPAIVGGNRSHPIATALGHASFFLMLAGALFIFIY